jgi:hypothetical protein
MLKSQYRPPALAALSSPETAAKKGCDLLSLRSEPDSVVEVGLLVLVWVVLSCTLSLDVVLIIHPLGAGMSTLLGLVGVVLVHAFSLGAENYQYVPLQPEIHLNLQLINFSTDEASQKLLGELVGNCLACGYLVSPCETRLCVVLSNPPCVDGPRRASCPQKQHRLRSARG